MAPPKRNTHQVMLRVHQTMLDALDDLIAGADDDPSRPEMIRRILTRHLRGQGYDVRDNDAALELRDED
ncbi:hypothetical protein SAMN04488095_2347 [Jannaschia pohangensis]|uniref:Ribbon-helix-helix protein, copG family n=2 Tax=Jannaschia pohangensis TaxID=390807 RepID=A0A1I3PYM5_9RHOB|nr:hypothetical protein SAMN04488095_2347 [Jannaschia pohangensis]